MSEYNPRHDCGRDLGEYKGVMAIGVIDYMRPTLFHVIYTHSSTGEVNGWFFPLCNDPSYYPKVPGYPRPIGIDEVSPCSSRTGGCTCGAWITKDKIHADYCNLYCRENDPKIAYAATGYDWEDW